MPQADRQPRGFTLVELIVVLAVVAAISALSIPLYANFQAENRLAVVAGEIVAALREAQTRAMAGDGDSRWGVYFDDDPGGNGDQFVLFRGATYASRDAGFDLATELVDSLSLGSISFSGGSAVVFDKIKGTTGNTGSVVLSSASGDSATVRVNAAGVVDLE